MSDQTRSVGDLHLTTVVVNVPDGNELCVIEQAAL